MTMTTLNLEEVFKLSGVPSYTFVEPVEYNKLLVALRTPGRGVVIEGPSGIGKTTAVHRALEKLKLEVQVQSLSARRQADRDSIENLLNTAPKDSGLIIIDDFHRLSVELRQSLADCLKVLADEERDDIKLVVIGINSAGESLIKFGDDLNARIEILTFEANPDDRIERLISQGVSISGFP